MNIFLKNLYDKKMITTDWIGRVKPSSNWGERTKPTTEYTERVRPYRYRAPLRDLTNIVCNEDWNIIYILANEGVKIPPIWHTR